MRYTPNDPVARASLRTAIHTLRRLRDEASALQKYQLNEARKLPGWKSLNRTDKHVARHLVPLLSNQGEIFLSEEKLATLIPPAPTKRRPNTRGHIHRTTLRASLERIKAAGIFTSWKTNGKFIGWGYDRRWKPGWSCSTPAIKVLRLHRDAWGRAWATLKYAFRRGNLYRVRAEANVRGEAAPDRSFRGGWKVPPEDRDNDSRARTCSRWRSRGFKLPFTAIEAIYPYEDEFGNVMYLVVRLPGKRFLHVFPEAAQCWRGEIERAA